MRQIGSILGLVALSAVFLPLLAVLLFAMPLEFVVATWHNLRLDAATEGLITDSEVTMRRGSGEGSAIAYSYRVGGSLYESSRWRAGLFSNASREEGGGEFAEDHPAGTPVKVFYDSSDPGFSLLQRGWPKWSLGFSMVVWGILSSYSFKRTDIRTRRLLVGYPISRALSLTGFLTIVLFPPTLEHEALRSIVIGFFVTALLALLWLLSPIGRDAETASKRGESGG